MDYRLKIELKEGQNLFFTSDTHHNHTNICRGITQWRNKDGSIPLNKVRDFDNLSKMNETIISNINEVVGQDNILIHLGDWSFGGFESIKEFKDRIICQNIYLICGNHDEKIRDNVDGCQGYFTKVFPSYCELEVKEPQISRKVKAKKHQFILSHYPLMSWNYMNRGAIHLFGHVHLSPNQREMKSRSMDVGVDGNYLRPNSMRDILSLLGNKPICSNFENDHHLDEINQIG